MRFFITATGTGIGKTYVTAVLLKAARDQGLTVRGVKPVLSGYAADDRENDACVILAAQGLSTDRLDDISPWRYAAPLSPDMAAAREGKQLPLRDVAAFTQDVLAGPEDLIVVEGVGGAYVPLDPTRTVKDWMDAANAPILLVTGTYLGALSHTLATVRALKADGLEPFAVVVNESAGDNPPFDEVLASLRSHLPVMRFYSLRRDEDGRALFAALQDAWQAASSA